MSFKMHKIIFLSEKNNWKNIYVCLLYIKCSDLFYPKHTFFYLALPDYGSELKYPLAKARRLMQ